MSSQKIRTELSKKNPYYISKYRRKELEYFCLQYKDYKDYLSVIGRRGTSSEWSDPTGDEAIKRSIYENNIRIIESSAKLADDENAEYILKAVTEGLTWPYISTHYNVKCYRNEFYNSLYKFFYILSSQKEHTF